MSVSSMKCSQDVHRILDCFTFCLVSTFGPVTQRYFLTSMGIDVRKQV